MVEPYRRQWSQNPRLGRCCSWESSSWASACARKTTRKGSSSARERNASMPPRGPCGGVPWEAPRHVIHSSRLSPGQFVSQNAGGNPFREVQGVTLVVDPVHPAVKSNRLDRPVLHAARLPSKWVPVDRSITGTAKALPANRPNKITVPKEDSLEKASDLLTHPPNL